MHGSQEPLRRCNESQKGLQSVLTLICRFVPAIIKLGILVWDCTWEHRIPGIGQCAPQVMHYALLLILLLRGDAHDPYVNALFDGVAMWNNVHDARLAAGFVGECCESLLSRLSCITAKHKVMRSVKDEEAQWQSLRPSIRLGRTPVHLGARSPVEIASCLQRLL